MKDSNDISKQYLESCRNEFWQKVFQLELEYLVQHMQGCRDVLSVGCGPAIMEGDLAKRGFNLTGLDVSQEALNCAPDQVRTVASRARVKEGVLCDNPCSVRQCAISRSANRSFLAPPRCGSSAIGRT